MTTREHKNKIWDLIKRIKVGMLCTQVAGDLESKPMYLVQDDYDGKIWFYTDLRSEKVFDLLKTNTVNLAFSEPNEQVYVSLTGDAHIIQDRQLIDKFWSPRIAAWFPEGKDSKYIGLIQIDVTRGEHWDSTSSKLMQFYEIVKANLTGKTPELGENQSSESFPNN